MIINGRVYFWHSILLIFISIHMPVPHCFDRCSFAVSFEIGKYDNTNFLFFKIIQSSLHFQMKLRISLLISSFYLTMQLSTILLSLSLYLLCFSFCESLLSRFWVSNALGWHASILYVCWLPLHPCSLSLCFFVCILSLVFQVFHSPLIYFC